MRKTQMKKGEVCRRRKVITAFIIFITITSLFIFRRNYTTSRISLFILNLFGAHKLNLATKIILYAYSN